MTNQNCKVLQLRYKYNDALHLAIGVQSIWQKLVVRPSPRQANKIIKTKRNGGIA